MTLLEIYVVAIVHFGAVVATLFPLYYSRSPWRSTDVGRALMVKGTAVAALFDVSVLGYWWPYPAGGYVNAAVITAVVVGVTWQFLVMRRHQKRGRRAAVAKDRF